MQLSDRPEAVVIVVTRVKQFPVDLHRIFVAVRMRFRQFGKKQGQICRKIGNPSAHEQICVGKIPRNGIRGAVKLSSVLFLRKQKVIAMKHPSKAVAPAFRCIIHIVVKLKLFVVEKAIVGLLGRFDQPHFGIAVILFVPFVHPLCPYPFILADAKQQLPILNVEKLKLFDEIFRLLNCAARVHGATIDALIDENELVGKIRLKCAEFDIILGDEDVIRRALVFALKKSDTVVVQSVEGKVAVTITVSLKKYLTN